MIVLGLALTACSGGRRDVHIEVAIPGPDSVDAPVAHLQLVALPYDRDSVLQALEAGRSRPPGLAQRLDSLFTAFRGPFGHYAAAAYRVQTLEREQAYRKARLDSLPRSSAAYDTLYRAFVRAADSIAQARDLRERTQNELAIARSKYSPTIDSLRRIMAQWEDSTYRGYDSITKSLSSGLGSTPISDSTGADGSVTLRLPPGRWWIYARSWDAWDPHSEWYWNVPVTGNHLALDKRSGRRIPRY